MDNAWLVPLSMLLGGVFGAGVVVLIITAERTARAADVAERTLPDGVAAVIATMHNPAVVVDPSNTVVAASPQALTVGLVVRRKLVHRELVDLVDRVRKSGEMGAEDLELPRGRGSDQIGYLSFRAAQLGNRYVLVTADDLTETRRIDEVRRDFVANISHELKTPIGAIGLLSETLVAAADEPQHVRKFAAQLVTESERLAALTKDIIELSRLQSVDTLENSEETSIDRIVQAAVDANEIVARARDIELVRAKKSKLRVMGDPALLQIAVSNLIANAVKYSPDNTRVGVGVRSAKGFVEIAVTDQGVGIPEADLDRVFERFYRVDPARSRATGGTGLGLAIVKHVVGNHGGDVRVWSQPGKGSTFTIRLPEADPELTTALEEQLEEQPS
ncbi:MULTISPECIES: cell wall metabolism sensor histidine kinase WalK [unclassified Curtobacterium]|jgi:two-component system sensor histidine kinase SenX3|uniref:sensor histidine kinase n=1 Tax=unclassified Curtobacterium TaxID=257496 RepID=UPI00089DE2B8|nr:MULTISPECIES: ATP-binding protein [unclassified Curtobacterium]AOX66081.1 two-component sensor histidine kinase [Curtobacterium sp. BH-2-1-1]MCT9622267.1 two-component sensor histidine kinase [Curtobacterium sp. C2H10]OII21105.1 two-component sensor histidine kinase [Curtobacterium sp. MCBA15_016]OII25878.1 two-component sensor histidine kinase [Curtobacterium sp. MCBA15_013]SFF50942.1 two-component system, OmpR family, sensor histidine kinase SenX3 [Curtobacterium sp. YR515]